MPSAIRWSGLEAFLDELGRLGPDLADEAAIEQRAIAEATADTLRAAYPVVTGRLRASVQVEYPGSASPARRFAQLVVGAPYAEFVEFGTARTRPSPAFVPISRRGREAFVKAVVARVRDRGFHVTGEII